jgi:[protein-PII] uridylyltransferase
VGRLVRRHLLLTETATTRDLDDPATLAQVAERVGDTETLDLLEALTEADARATAPAAWSSWRAALVTDLARRVRGLLGGAPVPADGAQPAGEVAVPARVRHDPAQVAVLLEESAHGSTLTVVSGDRVGLIADVAGALATGRLSVRAARAWTQGAFAVSVWEVAEDGLDEAILRQRLEAVLGGRLDPATRVRPRERRGPEPAVLVRHEASRTATVLEVRVDDRPGVVYAVCRALAALDVSVRSAHVATLGPQAVDVFYVGEPGAGALTDDRAAAAAHAVRAALTPAVTLGT